MVKSLQIALLGIRKWLSNPRMYLVFLMLAVFEWTLVQDVRAYAVSVGMSISCWYFPFLFVNGINCLFYYLTLILMYCNAPYVDEHQIYVMLRSGRTDLFAGQILYTVFASFLFFLADVNFDTSYSDRGIFATSRYKSAFDDENAVLIYEDAAAQTEFSGKLGQKDSSANAISNWPSAYDEIEIKNS